MIKVSVVSCPVCTELIEVEHPFKGQVVECPDCGEVFKVVRLDPIELHYAFEQNNEPDYADETYPRN